MTFTDQIREHQSRCHPYLRLLWLLARDEDEVTVPRQVTVGVREATTAVIAQAETTIRAGLAATADSNDPAMEVFLRVRLTRLADAADEAVKAARACDTPRLRSVLRRFEALTSAIWTVQQDLYGNVPLPRIAEGDGSDPTPQATANARNPLELVADSAEQAVPLGYVGFLLDPDRRLPVDHTNDPSPLAGDRDEDVDGIGGRAEDRADFGHGLERVQHVDGEPLAQQDHEAMPRPDG